MNEMVDIIDENNSVIAHELRDNAHLEGLQHRVSAVLLKRPDGKYLIPTASQHKVESGHLFHSAGGHVIAGESYIACAVREVWEELGLKTEDDNFKEIGSYWLKHTYPTRDEKERFQVYELRYQPQMGEIVMNYEQHTPQWFSFEELRIKYSDQEQLFSLPLRLTCSQIFKF
ncbi:NUDIX hydrolase [candidate division WWE3 bacterium]|nr:NUDIX hydrolase [candidate division WWE3 bacterium]